jgi:hypothetical protein
MTGPLGLNQRIFDQIDLKKRITIGLFSLLLTFQYAQQQYLHFLLQPPRSGRYTFYLSGDDQCRLSISSDYSSKNLRMIAMFPRGLWTRRNQWNKYVSYINRSSIVVGIDITCVRRSVISETVD